MQQLYYSELPGIIYESMSSIDRVFREFLELELRLFRSAEETINRRWARGNK